MLIEYPSPEFEAALSQYFGRSLQNLLNMILLRLNLNAQACHV
jgi:hypothetical protein